MSARILIVDDDPILSGMLKLTLELEGFEVSVANDGEEGLAAVASQDFALVILDLVMPKIDGVKFLRLLAQMDQTRPPIMIASSAIEEKLTRSSRALGVVDIARKPLGPQEFVARVKKALQQVQVGPEAQVSNEAQSGTRSSSEAA